MCAVLCRCEMSSDHVLVDKKELERKNSTELVSLPDSKNYFSFLKLANPLTQEVSWE